MGKLTHLVYVEKMPAFVRTFTERNGKNIYHYVIKNCQISIQMKIQA